MKYRRETLGAGVFMGETGRVKLFCLWGWGTALTAGTEMLGASMKPHFLKPLKMRCFANDF